MKAPDALRLVCAAPVVRPPRPPFKLAGWSTEAPALAVLLDATVANVGEAGEIAPQVPEASTLAPGTRVYVLGQAMRLRRGIGRWLGPAAPPVARAVRCAALVARGYTGVGALTDASGADLVYGDAPSLLSP
jgi:hypothetical protein